MRAFESAVVGLALAAVVAGSVLGILVAPPFTRALLDRLDVASAAGLSPARTAALAEQVRRFVTDRDSPPLPAEVDAAPAFDESAVSHLEDVRDVLLAARRVTGVLAAALAVWLALSVARKRFSAIVSALFVGAACCAAIPALAAVLAASDFDWFFAAFHALFFESGTWTFPYDALLIRLFPEAFWASAGAAWAAGVLLGGAVLAAVAFGVRSADRGASGTPRGRVA